MSPRPADACPYRRPFPPGFSICPTYKAAVVATPTQAQRPSLQVDLTCVHLDVGSSEAVGRYYARCSLGTAADRARRAGLDAEPDRTPPGRTARRASEAGGPAAS